MKQPKIHITDINGKDWGVFDIMQLNWQNDKINSVLVNWYKSKTNSDYMSMYLYDNKFKNSHKNLIGELL